LNEGLEEGETIVLNLREHLNLMDLPDVTAVDNTELATLVAKRGGPMKKAKEGEDSGPPPPPWMAGAIDKTFENDTDGDGTLDKKEIQAIDGRFRPMVATADKDKDGKVTRKEMTAAFMKSTQNGGGGRPGGGRPGGWGGRAGGGGRPTGVIALVTADQSLGNELEFRFVSHASIDSDSPAESLAEYHATRIRL
ncbi:MAG: EF-hand domain-containing protein, partial [Planctomycetota bacterium]